MEITKIEYRYAYLSAIDSYLVVAHVIHSDNSVEALFCVMDVSRFTKFINSDTKDKEFYLKNSFRACKGVADKISIDCTLLMTLKHLFIDIMAETNNSVDDIIKQASINPWNSNVVEEGNQIRLTKKLGDDCYWSFMIRRDLNYCASKKFSVDKDSDLWFFIQNELGLSDFEIADKIFSSALCKNHDTYTPNKKLNSGIIGSRADFLKGLKENKLRKKYHNGKGIDLTNKKSFRYNYYPENVTCWGCEHATLELTGKKVRCYMGISIPAEKNFCEYYRNSRSKKEGSNKEGWVE